MTGVQLSDVRMSDVWMNSKRLNDVRMSDVRKNSNRLNDVRLRAGRAAVRPSASTERNGT
ncbi:hypothetical protein MJ257_11795 [Paenibacillus timonensis]|uniref:Uncharacterized protein n=1 Tax=Paenibacillus timonensis TaxID=225915 RepID=A0ABW3SDZ2_9BACL|nr:hypothetical protein [Paenibacillus timonensis]MCH1640790.1 hypothetical protein [Paenibacillus timonensis]